MYFGSLGGVKVYLHWSIFVMVFFFAYSLSVSFLPATVPDKSAYTTGMFWLAGIATSLLLWVSILLHELSHCWAAKLCGLPVDNITLFLLGGISSLGSDLSDSPLIECQVAIAGPLMTLFLGGAFVGFFYLFLPVEALLAASFLFLSIASAMILVFNLLPLFPLDGGRVFRASIMACLGGPQYRVKATKIATMVSLVLCWALIFYAVFAITTADLFGGIWLVLIAVFLMFAAKGELQHVLMTQSLQGLTCGDLCTKTVIEVPNNVSVQEFLQSYVMVSRHRCYPCYDPSTGRVTGLVFSGSVQRLTQSQRNALQVGDVAVNLVAGGRAPAGIQVVNARSKVTDAFATLARDERLLVVDDDNALVGILTLRDVLREIDLASSFAGGLGDGNGGSGSQGGHNGRGPIVYAQASGPSSSPSSPPSPPNVRTYNERTLLLSAPV